MESEVDVERGKKIGQSIENGAELQDIESMVNMKVVTLSESGAVSTVYDIVEVRLQK